jgi:HSP20 family protein
MTLITRWDPFREFVTLQDRMSRLLRDSQGGQEEALTTTTFAPPVDVYEDEHNVTLKIEVPGIDEKDIDVRVENNTLIVHGERKFEKEEKEENFRRVERQYGSFTRTFTLPQTVDPENVQANYDKGVLKIQLAKREEAKPKQIKINVGSATQSSAPQGSQKTIERKPAKSAA